MATHDQILEFIKQKGPIIPVQLAKQINTDILFASAHLSELSSSNKVKISHIKIGGSPLYYLPGQETSLERFSDNLNEKEKKAYDLLKEKKVLRDKDLEPLFQVAIRQIKDYAQALEVSYQGAKEIFWKWHTIPQQETESIIGAILNPKKEEKTTETKKQEQIQETDKQAPVAAQQQKKEFEEQKPLKEREEKKPEQLQKPIPKKPIKKTKPEQKSEFLEITKKYFLKNKIEIIEHTPVKKSEHEFIISIPSAVGNLTYFCKAKDKKSINDGDISSAYIQSQSKKLPAIILTTGKLTKKAKELFEKEFKGMNIQNI